MKNKYEFYEIVKISSNKVSLKEINNSEGTILGMAKNEETGRWGYAVSVILDNGLVWDVMEEDLKPTGKKADPKEFMSGESIKIEVDPETGEGSISDKK